MPRTKGALGRKTIEDLKARGLWDEENNRPMPGAHPSVPVDVGRTVHGGDDSMMPPIEAVFDEDPISPNALGGSDSIATASPATADSIPVGMTFIEYTAPSGAVWRVERGAELRRDFDLSNTSELGQWHQVFCGEEHLWLTLRRLYTIAPMMGETTPEDIRLWSREEWAAEIGAAVAQLDAVLAEAKLKWNRARLQLAAVGSVPSISGKTEDVVLTDAQIAQVLKRHDFDGFEMQPDEKRVVAKRCLDLQEYLEDVEGRSIARNAIMEEWQIMILDKRIIQSRISEDTMMKLMQRRKDSVSQHTTLMETLGATRVQRPSLQKKVAFVDCLSQLIAGMQEYYSRGGTELIDGMFTAAEVELLLKPTTLRPPQYRPDVVLAVIEAQDHLWEEKWKLEGFDRMTLRRLRAGFAAGAEAIRAESGEGTGDLEADEQDDLTVEKLQTGKEGAMPGMMTGIPQAGPDPGSMAAGEVQMGADDVAVI